MAGLTLSHLYKRYENSGKKKKTVNDFAVKDLNLECEQGEFVAFLGPSGCGKTTTLRMIAGLEDITDGDIYIGDRRVNDLHPKDRHIGLAFEDYAMYPPLTVYDNVAFNLRAKGVDKAEIDRRVREIAPLMQIDDLLDKMPVKLSGGQKQRVNIARAIIREPELLLMDEPLSHLDGKARQAMRTEIKRLIHKIKCTTVYVTHDQLEAMSLADKIAVINFGVLQQYGTPAEVYDDPVNEFVASFIGRATPAMRHFWRTTTVKIDKRLSSSPCRTATSKISPCPSGIKQRGQRRLPVQDGRAGPMDVLVGRPRDSQGPPREKEHHLRESGRRARIGYPAWARSLLMLIHHLTRPANHGRWTSSSWRSAGRQDPPVRTWRPAARIRRDSKVQVL